jgi:hypothetical protein
MGLVANGGADQHNNVYWMEAWDSGNQTNFLTGFTFGAGDFQIAPISYGKNLLSQLCK